MTEYEKAAVLCGLPLPRIDISICHTIGSLYYSRGPASVFHVYVYYKTKYGTLKLVDGKPVPLDKIDETLFQLRTAYEDEGEKVFVLDLRQEATT